MIQKMNIHALHKEGKSQRVITERCGCLQSAVSKHTECNVTGRKNLGRKRCTSNRDDWKLENTVKQSWFKHLWELHKEWTEAGVSASRVTTLRHLQEKGYQATSEPETTSEASYLGCGENNSVVQSPLFRWKYILHFIWKSRSQSLEEEWRAGPVLNNYRRVGWQISWVGIGGGGGSSRYLYCRYCYINYINYSLLYVHWRKKKKKTFMGSLEYHALELFFLYWIIIIKTPLCSLSLNHCFYTGDFFN